MAVNKFSLGNGELTRPLKMSNVNFQMNLGLDYSLVISLTFAYHSWRKDFISSALWQDTLSSLKWLDHHQENVFYCWKEKLFKISMYTCAWIVEAIITNSPGLLNVMQSHIMNDLGNLLVFFRQSSWHVSWNLKENNFVHYHIKKKECNKFAKIISKSRIHC